jgi:N-acetylmuramoyl-L-alanine amidase
MSKGTDRLGSAKMGYIDTGIVLRVADTSGGLYTVRLSANRLAYLDMNAGSRVVPANWQPVVTTASWRAKPGVGYDSLSIGLGQKVPYTTHMLLHPARIVLHLYGVQANTNWITQLQGLQAIGSLDYRQVETDVVEVTISLRDKHHSGHRVIYKGNTLHVLVKHAVAGKGLRHKTIVVDAGHGGSNTGAKGVATGILEKEYTLLFAKALQRELTRKGAKVLMVRTTDTAIDNKDRVLWATAANPDAFISIHLNAAGRPTVRGTSTYYKHVAFSNLSQAILRQLLKVQQLEEFGLIGSFNFQPVQPTAFPSTLVEVAFLSNPQDEAMIMKADFRKKVAKAIRKGLQQWLRNP